MSSYGQNATNQCCLITIIISYKALKSNTKIIKINKIGGQNDSDHYV
jgi:hypothetical protein